MGKARSVDGGGGLSSSPTEGISGLARGPALDGVALGRARKRGGGLGTFWWWHGWGGCEGSATAAFGSGRWWPRRHVQRWIKI